MHELVRQGEGLSRMDKQNLTERDICTKFITPALRKAGWDEMLQIREEVSFTKGRIIGRQLLPGRGDGDRVGTVAAVISRYHGPRS
jgi:type I restriction enzyme, R subunit